MPLQHRAITLLVVLIASRFVAEAQDACLVAAAAPQQRPAAPAAFDAAQGEKARTANVANPWPQSSAAEVQGWPGPRPSQPEDTFFATRSAAHGGDSGASGDSGQDFARLPQAAGKANAAQGGVDQSSPRSTGDGPWRTSTPQSSVSASDEAPANSPDGGGRKGTRLSLPPPRATGSQQPGNLRFGVPLLVTVGGSLALVLGVFFLIAWAVRSAAPRGLTVLPSEVLEVLGRAPLAGRQQLHLLRCGKKLVLVSVTPAGAETLTEITDPEEVDRLAGLCQQARPNSATAAFGQVLRQLAGQHKVAEETLGSRLDASAPAPDLREEADA